MNEKTIKLIYNAFKNCSEYFERMAEFDECECEFNQILKKIKSFFSRKQLINTEYNGKVYTTKGKIELFFDYLTPIAFIEVCLLGVLCSCKINVKLCFENHFATNELILSLVNKTASYYGFDNFITLEKEENNVNAICENGRVLILRKSRKYSRFNQKDLLILQDGEDKK